MSLVTASRPLSVLSLTVLFLACGRSPAREAGSKTRTEPKPAAVAAAGPLWEEPQLSAMMKAYHDALPGKRMVLNFNMNVGGASLQVQDPAKPENVDQYNYRDGEVSAPIPVRLHLFGGKLEDSLFDWDQVAIDRIPELARVAMEKIPLEGGKVRGARVGHDIVDTDGKVYIRVDVEGTRKTGTLKADDKGNVVEADEDA